ncbi:HNH endonuclease family protein [Pseudoalteromonas sp. BDTF-M6]|uniref:HNH endonuclease family protein n=1 Tax=Pseudoalteromonas sp. BDTF-M6 TaxID=2796132 RepID=UPI001BAE751A|nr:HNH endonuclease family protein [Pseudoalteromonas sp. BDTF-M6]MBS3798204.1 HNH endonuclease [Pseudoalteromonas sp. BDTF-M6]
MSQAVVTSTFFATILLFTLPACQAETVKMSKSGICHTPDSAHYQRTTSFTTYADVPSCLDAGGRLPKGYGQEKIAPRARGEYNRDDWPHWLDEDNDCQDTRAEVLIAQSQAQVSFNEQQQCRVTLGAWTDPYSGKQFTSDDDLDIDHIVPLKFASEHGGAHWSRSEKARFANDMDNLLAVDDGLNRSKGAKGPTEWLPPKHDYRCEYLARFNAVMTKYRLNYTAQEQRTLTKMRSACS